MILNNGKVWEFDSAVAGNFVNHARCHIPNYEKVITKCLKLADYLISKNSYIIDIGCATGYTLSKFEQKGYTNLYGVDNSQSMIDQCSVNANIILSETFPELDIKFSAILANWTLHFIEDKESYIKKIYDHLSSDGFAVVSEKISENPTHIKFYHDWKHEQGVSQEEIIAKANSLKGVMKTRDIQWWISCFQKTGFRKINIIDADWCFCSFLLQK